MAADCKSAAPRSYGGSNPPLCTRIGSGDSRTNRLDREVDCVAIWNSHGDLRSSRTAGMANVVGQESPADRDGSDWNVCAADLGVSPARDAAEFGQQRREIAVGEAHVPSLSWAVPGIVAWGALQIAAERWLTGERDEQAKYGFAPLVLILWYVPDALFGFTGAAEVEALLLFFSFPVAAIYLVILLGMEWRE